MVIVVTGVMAAGKSTVAQLLAERLPGSVHVRGDVFRRMIVTGSRNDLALRYELSATVAKRYADAGFTVVVQDIILGADLPAYAGMVPGCRLVVLCPRPEVVAVREARRPKTGYGEWTVEALDRELRATPRIGFWLDNSDQTPDETAAAILTEVGCLPG